MELTQNAQHPVLKLDLSLPMLALAEAVDALPEVIQPSTMVPSGSSTATLATPVST